MDLVERKGTLAQRHPWEVARAEFFLRLLIRNGLLETGQDWLDVGAGDAWFAKQLHRLLPSTASVTCWDVNYLPEDLAATDDAGTERLRLVKDRPGAPFDRMLMLDVIEHVENDAEFVTKTVHDLLVPGGALLVSVPAYQVLFSSHDRTLHHYRRYSPTRCRQLLEQAGLAVLSDGGLFHALLPVRLGQLLLERVRPIKSLSNGIGDWQAGKTATRALTRALIAEGRLSLAVSRGPRSLPGLTYWALCRFQGA